MYPAVEAVQNIKYAGAPEEFNDLVFTHKDIVVEF
jgi:hypothetical protein